MAPSTSTLFKAIAERPDGCKSVDFVMVQMVNKAWVTAMNSVAICEGEEVELEAEHSPDNMVRTKYNCTSNRNHSV
ncbi:MAG: hypothetical protein LBH34_01985 [Prevotellaceae bacterium]|nr:hypothetical protein [Prevotellaceae bacterium]